MSRLGVAAVALLAFVACMPPGSSAMKNDYSVNLGRTATWDKGADFGNAHSRNWTFLDRFAYGLEGRWQWTMDIEGPVISDYTNNGEWQGFFLLGFIENDWAKINDGMNCTTLVSTSNNQFTVPSQHNASTSKLNCVKTTLETRKDPTTNKTVVTRASYNCDGDRTFGALVSDEGDSLAEQYWFFVLACCDCGESFVKFNQHLTNGEDNWTKEFSTDESWVYTLVVAIVVIDFVALFAQWHSDAKHASSSHLSRFAFKLAICFDIIAAFCYIAHFRAYSNSGTGNEAAFIAGDVFWIFGELTMMTLLLALAKGWTIYRPTLRKESVIKMAIFLFAYTVTHIVVLIVERTEFSRETITFRYDSNAGTAMCCIYFFGWGWFSWYIYVTLKPMIHGNRGGAGLNENNNEDLNTSYQRAMAVLGNEQACPPEKYKFFQAFWVVYTIWFLMWPIAIFALIDNAPAFTRLNSAWTVRLARHALGLLVLLALWWPNVRNVFFPFERSATTIGQTPHKTQGEGNESARTTANAVVARRNIFSGNDAMTAGSTSAPTGPAHPPTASGHTEADSYTGISVDDSSNAYLQVNASPSPQPATSPSPKLAAPAYNNKLPPIQPDFRQANV